MRSLAFICALFVAACGGHELGEIDDVVGSSCATDRDCDSRCYRGDDFPGGFCSLPCASDNDCPGDTFCMSESGGVCMFACPAFDCRRLGSDWECRDKSRQNGGRANVCSGD
jgi:hypothetical protein